MFGVAPLPRTVDAALRDAEAKRVDVRRSALNDLVRHVDGPRRDSVLEALSKRLSQDPDVEVRAFAALACADAGARELLRDLFGALDDPAPRVVQMALLAIGELAAEVSDGDWNQLLVLSGSELPALRYQALSTLFRLRAEQTIPDLLQALVDSDEEIRWLAWHLLDQWQARVDPSSAPSPSAVASGGFRMESVLEEPARLRALIALAEREPPRIRAEALLLLLRLKVPQGVALVRSLVDSSQRLDRDQCAALIARLGEEGYEEGIPWLSRFSKLGWFEGPLAWISTVSLARLGDSSARKAIISELDSRSANRRCRALEAVRALRISEAASVVERLARTGAPGLSVSEAEAVLKELRAAADGC
ncbi:MAG: HEAT repeat domain-containing protein [Polyangiaceae bacterium]